MSERRKRPPIVVADDSEDDRLLAQRALKAAKVRNPVVFQDDGQALLDYLHESEVPALILLDLNMPRKDGFEVLDELRGDERFKHVPIVVLTTSQAACDVEESYRRGANSFVTKAPRYQDFVQEIRVLTDYWLRLVRLPPNLAA